MNFAEAVATNPPRLVVLYCMGGDGNEQFQWGVVGSIPILTLIGRVAAIQNAIVNEEWMPVCNNDPQALCITWHAETREMLHFVDSDIPREPLVGMLEVIKSSLVGGRLGMQAMAQRFEPPVLGPDGKPIRG